MEMQHEFTGVPLINEQFFHFSIIVSLCKTDVNKTKVVF